MAPTMALSKAEQNALCVSYDVLGTHVELDLQFVKRYLVRGNPDKITDQEIVFFMNTCKMQKLNPLVAGEVYCIKFGNDPAQMVVGKGAYLRRAYEHPDYLCKEDGILQSPEDRTSAGIRKVRRLQDAQQRHEQIPKGNCRSRRKPASL